MPRSVLIVFWLLLAACDAESGCHDYCLRCNDGSTVWMHRWRAPWNVLAAPISLPLQILHVTSGLAPSMGLTCQKMSLSKFDRLGAPGGEQCQRDQMTKAGWFWRGHSEDHLRKDRFVEKGDNSLLRSFSDVQNDRIAYEFGCSLLMNSVGGEKNMYDSAFFDVGEAAWLCASHSNLCGVDGVAGFVNADNSERCQSICREKVTGDDGLPGVPFMFSNDWQNGLEAHVSANYLTGKPVAIEVQKSPSEQDAHELSPFFNHLGAMVKNAGDDWRAKGIVDGSVLLTFNGKNIVGKEFDDFQAMRRGASLPVTYVFALPRKCGEGVMSDILSKFVILKDKDNRHMYVGCRGKSSKDRRKVSCDPRECEGEPWCFVPPKCGRLLVNPCKKADVPPLPCGSKAVSVEDAEPAENQHF